VLALAALAGAIAVAIHFFPATTIASKHIHTQVLPTKTKFNAQTAVVGGPLVLGNTIEETLFVASTIQLDNQMRVPIFLDGFTLTFTNTEDAQLTAKALTPAELANAELSFPALKALASTPLTTETTIDPGHTAQGTVIFALTLRKSMWDERKRATIKVDVYHQYPVYQDIPK
jgi:hypothetical protein